MPAMATVNRALSELPADRRAPWLLDLARLQQRKSSDLALATLDKLVREYPKSPEARGGTRPQGPDSRERGARSGTPRVDDEKLAADYPDQEEAGSALWRLGWLSWFRGAHAEAAARWAAPPCRARWTGVP